ncbi:MAG: hypothetical protein ABR878_18295 [Roseiarcus sp.]|jgi:hypothetical protein
MMILAGHSHINALVGNRFSADVVLQEISAHKGLLSLDGPWPRNDAYWEKLIAQANGNRIALVWGGNEHNSCYLFDASYQFDFRSRHVTKIMNRLQIVAQSTIRKKFWDLSIRDLSRFLANLTKSYPSRIVLLGTPPPKKDNEALKKLLAAEPHFLEWAAQIGGGIDQVKLTAPHIRLKLWYVLQDLLAEEAGKVAGSFVRVPVETQDEEGFLKPEFSAHDVTHANEAYGALMLAKLIEELDR